MTRAKIAAVQVATLVLTLLTPTTASRAATNLVADGDFATPAQSPDEVTTYSRGQIGSSPWFETVGTAGNNSAGSIDLVANGAVIGGIAFTAPPGDPSTTQIVDLDGFRPGAVEQTLTALTPGVTYLLGVQVNANPNVAPLHTVSADVSVGGVSLGTITPATQASTGTLGPWTLETFPFTATSSSEDLEFASRDSSGEARGTLITDVSVLGPSGATQSAPEHPVPHNDHAGSNDPNPNTNPTTTTTATTATTNNPTVSTSCSSACSLGAVTRDERVLIDAADTGNPGGGGASFTAASVEDPAEPVFTLTINGGRTRPSCPGYRTRDRDWVQFAFERGGSTFRKVGRMTPIYGTPRPEAESRLGQDQVCFSAPYEFTPRPGFRLRHVAGWFDGVLPECTALPAGSGSAPCVSDRALVRVGDGWAVRLEFWVPPSRQDPKALG